MNSTSPALLGVSGLRAGYGKHEVIRDVDMHISSGEIVLVLGHNGAGKTTLLRSIFGLLSPVAGRVVFDGRDITGKTPRDNVAGGMAFVPQGHGVFPRLTVAENLRLGGYTIPDAARLEAALQTVHALFPILGSRAQQAAGTMSGGQQQMVAIGVALMSSPRLLILDEPSIGLAPALVTSVLESLGRINREFGTTVLFVEQNVARSLPLAHRAIVLRGGRIAFVGPAAALTDHARLIELF